MLSLFRKDGIGSTLLLFAVAALLRLGAWLGVVPMPDFSGSEGLISLSDVWGVSANPAVSVALSTVFVTVQGLLINRLVQKQKMLRTRTLQVALLYVVMASLLPPFLFFSPVLVALIFVCLSFFSLFDIYRNVAYTPKLFDSIFWLTIASFFYPPAIWLFPAYFVGILIIHSVRFGDFVLMGTGYLVPLFLAFGTCFLTDEMSRLHRYFSAIVPSWPSSFFQDGFQPTPQNLGNSLFLMLLFLLVLSYRRIMSRKLIQIQKYLAFLFWYVFFVAVSYFFRHASDQLHIMLFAPAFAVLFIYFFAASKNRILAEVLFLLLVLSAFFLHFSDLILVG